MLGYLSMDIICSEKRTVFRKRSSRKTVTFEEQIMSKDKYPSIFSQPNWGYCVYYPSVLKIGEYPQIFPGFSRGIFAHAFRPIASEQKYLVDYKYVYNPPNNVCGLSLDKTDHVIQNQTVVITRYLAPDLISIAWFYFNGKTKKKVNAQAEHLSGQGKPKKALMDE